MVLPMYGSTLGTEGAAAAASSGTGPGTGVAARPMVTGCDVTGCNAVSSKDRSAFGASLMGPHQRTRVRDLASLRVARSDPRAASTAWPFPLRSARQNGGIARGKVPAPPCRLFIGGPGPGNIVHGGGLARQPRVSAGAG